MTRYQLATLQTLITELKNSSTSNPSTSHYNPQDTIQIIDEIYFILETLFDDMQYLQNQITNIENEI